MVERVPLLNCPSKVDCVTAILNWTWLYLVSDPYLMYSATKLGNREIIERWWGLLTILIATPESTSIRRLGKSHILWSNLKSTQVKLLFMLIDIGILPNDVSIVDTSEYRENPRFYYFIVFVVVVGCCTRGSSWTGCGKGETGGWRLWLVHSR